MAPRRLETRQLPESDADVAQLVDLQYGPKTALSQAYCFARTIVATDAGTDDVVTNCRSLTAIEEILDLDGDSCTNLDELCDGTSPIDDSRAACGT